MLSKLTIAGINSYTDGHIFDELVLPEGVDKDTLITEIIRQSSEFSVLYTEPIFLSHMIGSWSKKWLRNFERWWTAYNFDYNALYNLEVEATYTDNGGSSTKGSSNSNGTVTGQKAGYDSSTFKDATRDVNSVYSNGNSTTTTNNVRTEKRFGNQGVTMSQEMLQAEYDVWKNNVYQMMAEAFVVEFCIYIYD